MFDTTTKESHATVDAGYSFRIRKVNTRAATVLIRNTGAKSAKVQLQGTINGTDFVNIGNEETVASGAAKVLSVSDYWPELRVIGKPATGGEQTTLWVESASVDS
jgi:hypothetical protein